MVTLNRVNLQVTYSTAHVSLSPYQQARPEPQTLRALFTDHVRRPRLLIGPAIVSSENIAQRPGGGGGVPPLPSEASGVCVEPRTCGGEVDAV